MINNAVKSNYLASKYLLDNLKKDKMKILHGQFLKGYGISLYGRDFEQKTYYDTQDTFFNKVGITININKIKGASKAELVVRFNNKARRIQFLDNIPDTFAIPIGLHSGIADNVDFITSAIYELIPNGISADVKALLATARPVMVVEKKRERYRAINASGLKVIMSFTLGTYSNKINGVKQKLEMLELEANARMQEPFENFNKLLTFEFANLIRTQPSDLDVALEQCTK